MFKKDRKSLTTTTNDISETPTVTEGSDNVIERIPNWSKALDDDYTGETNDNIHITPPESDNNP